MCLVILLTEANHRDVRAFFSFTTMPGLPVFLSVSVSLSLFHSRSLSLSDTHAHTIKNFMWTIILLKHKRRESFFHFPGALLSVSSCPSLALTFLLRLFLSSSPSLPFSFCLSPPSLSLSLSLSLYLFKKTHSFCPSNVDHCHQHCCALNEKNKMKTTLKFSFSCCFRIQCLAQFFFFFL